MLKKENFIDWYYFYHGFAALDWFRDFQYFPKVEYQFSKVFISLNRLHTNYRSYRLTLVNEYIEKNLLDFGHVSLNTSNHEQGSWLQELNSPHTLIAPTKIDSIKSNFKKIRNQKISQKEVRRVVGYIGPPAIQIKSMILPAVNERVQHWPFGQ